MKRTKQVGMTKLEQVTNDKFNNHVLRTFILGGVGAHFGGTEGALIGAGISYGIDAVGSIVETMKAKIIEIEDEVSTK